MPTNILVIEDNAPNLELMSYLLRAFEYEVSTAEDGPEGLELVRKNSPDLVICDIHLPTISGYEVARQMKQDPALKDIPLVAVTALAMVGDRDKVLSAGFDGYIPKPISPEFFVEQVEKFITPNLHSRASPRLHSASNPSPDSPSTPGKATILVVDDVPVNINLMTVILEHFGYSVKAAASVQEGFESWRLVQPDLVISDIHLLDGTGFDLVEQIKQDPSHVAPILLLSASAEFSDRVRAVKSGVVKLLRRPIEPEILVAEISAALANTKGTG